jgi:hypothetical protein
MLNSVNLTNQIEGSQSQFCLWSLHYCFDELITALLVNWSVIVFYSMFTAELLGLPLVPPYSEASAVQQVLQGANYASAAAGILNDSGANFVSNHGSPVFITNDQRTQLHKLQ